MHGQDLSDLWTIKLVGECLVAATRHAALTAGPTAPKAVKAIDYSFGLPFVDDITTAAADERRRPPLYDPVTVSRLEDALTWQARYLSDDPISVETLKVWIRAKTSPGASFDEACKACGWSRSGAYRELDTARGTIAQGLNTDRVQIWRP